MNTCKLTFFTIVFVSSIFLSGCAKSQEEKELKITDNNITIRIEGAVYPSKRQDIISPVAGKVSHLYVKYGDRVHKGDLIYSLDKELLQFDIANKKNEIASLKKVRNHFIDQVSSTHNISDVNLAALELKKLALLHSEGYVRDFELNSYKKNYINTLYSEKEKSSSQYEKLKTLNASIKTKEIELHKLEYQLKHSNGYANIDGFIANVAIQEGQTINSDAKVCTVVNLDKVLLKAGFATGLLPFIHVGQIVDISFITTPPYSTQAAIEQVTPIVDPKFDSMTLDIIVANQNYILQEGTRALITIQLSKEGQERVKKYFIHNKRDRVVEIQSKI